MIDGDGNTLDCVQIYHYVMID